MIRGIQKLIFGVLLLGMASPVFGQAPPPPEVMFLLDNSASMRRSPTSERADGLPSCIEDYEVRERNVNGAVERRVTSIQGETITTRNLSAMQMVRNVLGGHPIHSSRDPNLITCFRDSVDFPRDIAQAGYLELVNAGRVMGDEALVIPKPGDPDDAIFYRYVQGQCPDFNPARPEACRPFRLVDENTPDANFADDSVLEPYAAGIKFGMMTLDDDPGLARSWPISFGRLGSFGEDQGVTGPRVAAANLQFPGLIADAFIAPRLRPEGGIEAPNLGARGPGEGRPGDLIAGGVGMMVRGARQAFAPVAETETGIRSHTDYFKHQVRRLTAFGFSPMAAFLSDLAYYYQTQAGSAPDSFGLVPDLQYARRQHVAIMITSGGQTNYYGSRSCVRTGFRCQTPPEFPYRPMSEYVAALRETVPQFRLVVIGVGLDDAQNQTFRALVTRDQDMYNVRSADELRSAVNRVLASLDADRKSKVAPLVITPDLGDEVDDRVRQLRVTAYSLLADDTRYGRVDIAAHGCRGPGGGQTTGRLKIIENESLDLAVKLAQQDKRTTVGNAHQVPDRPGRPNYTILGNGNALFSDRGDFRAGGGLTEEEFREVMLAERPDAGTDPLDLVYKALSGFIGPAATPSAPGRCTPACGPDPDNVRQLGEVIEGDLVAIPPPRLAVEGGGYRRFREANKTRPTLIAVGAYDGQVHFFRAADGREVFTFAHRGAMPKLKSAVDNPRPLGADTLLGTREMVLCRTVTGDGDDECPSDNEAFDFRTIVAGATGLGGFSLFALDITDASPLFKVDTQNLPIPHNTIKAWEVGLYFDGRSGGAAGNGNGQNNGNNANRRDGQ